MNIVPKTTPFNVKIDPYLDRYDAACHDVSLAIFERALKNTNFHLYPQPASILLKTVRLLLTDLMIRVMHIISYLFQGIFYLIQLQGEKTKYYFYSALIWGPLTLLTKTASNCSRIFGCLVGFANPSSAIAIWLTAEMIDAFILKKIAYTPGISNSEKASIEIQGNAALFFGEGPAKTIYQSVQILSYPLPVTQPSGPPLILKLKNGKIREDIAELLKYLGSHYPLELERIFHSIPQNHPIYLNVRCLQVMISNVSQQYQIIQKEIKFEGVYRYCLAENDIIRMYFYILEKLQNSGIFWEIKTNSHYQSLEQLLGKNNH